MRIDYYDFPASAGTGNFLETESPEEIWVKDTEEAEDADYVIPISGDSMEPSFHDGDKVFVEKMDSIEKGDIGIFVVNGDVFIKSWAIIALSHTIKHINRFHCIRPTAFIVAEECLVW